MAPPEEPTGHQAPVRPAGEPSAAASPDVGSSEATNVTSAVEEPSSEKTASEQPQATDELLKEHGVAPGPVESTQKSSGDGGGEAVDAENIAPKDTPSCSDAADRPTTPDESNRASERPQPADHEPPDGMASSMVTIKAAQTPAKYLAPEAASYIDPTPDTPMTSQPPSRSPSNAASYRSEERSPSRSDVELDSGPEADVAKVGGGRSRDIDDDPGSQSEIQSIMEQFSEEGGGPGMEEVMSPRLELTSPILGGPAQHPPRKSSLEPLSQSMSNQLQELSNLRVSTSSPSIAPSKEQAPTGGDAGPPVPPKDGTFGTPPRKRPSKDTTQSTNVASPTSPQLSMHRLPPPEPEPEPTLPFDFHRFLEQLRNKRADPVARYLKSFLSEFGKKQWMVHEQVKIISDFLAFIANKMMLCDVWSDVSDAEFDNAREGMEKLVMNRLYSQTFSPAISAAKPVPGAKPRRRGGDMPLGPGRRGQHQEDVERDDIVAQKINIYSWVKEEHLDIPPVGDSGRRFLKLAQQELLKIKSYRAPRDKIICVLNCSKVIFGLLKHNKSDSSADSFMPLLIYVVLQCNPEHLVSNVQYILRFRNQEKLGGEAGYYLSSLMGAVQFVENMDRSSLTISDDDFERNVEAAVSAIAEKHQASSPVLRQHEQPSAAANFDEKARPHSSQAHPQDGGSTPRRSTSSYDGEGSGSDEKAAITGLLRTFQKPLTTIGRIFGDEAGSSSSTPASARHSPRPGAFRDEEMPPSHPTQNLHPMGQIPRHDLPAEEAAARQASAEAAEAQRLQRAEHANVVDTLAGMFPDLDKDVISDVVYEKQGRVGLAVDACLALSS